MVNVFNNSLMICKIINYYISCIFKFQSELLMNGAIGQLVEMVNSFSCIEKPKHLHTLDLGFPGIDTCRFHP